MEEYVLDRHAIDKDASVRRNLYSFFQPNKSSWIQDLEEYKAWEGPCLETSCPSGIVPIWGQDWAG